MGGGGFELIPVLIGFGLAGGIVGRHKGGSFWIWGLVSFCIPFLGLLAAALHRSERDELRRECPTCGKIVLLSDAVCTRCGTELEFPEVAIAPESGALPTGTPVA